MTPGRHCQATGARSGSLVLAYSPSSSSSSAAAAAAAVPTLAVTISDAAGEPINGKSCPFVFAGLESSNASPTQRRAAGVRRRVGLAMETSASQEECSYYGM